MDLVNSQNMTMNAKPTVIYFGAEWCSSCPTVEKYLTQKENLFPHVRFMKIDVKEDAAVAEAMRVLALPSIIFFDGNKEQVRFSGSTASKHIISYLADYYSV